MQKWWLVVLGMLVESAELSGAVAELVGPEVSVESVDQRPMPSSQMESGSREAPNSWTLTQAGEVAPQEHRGNWFRKRQILQQSRRLYQELSESVKRAHDVAQKLITEFGREVRESHKQLADLDMQVTDLDKVVESLSGKIAEESSKKVADAAQRQLLLDLNDSQKMLEAFRDNLIDVTQLQEALSKVIEIIKEQHARSQEYEQEGWKLYEQIDDTLNDGVAQRLFEQLQGFQADVLQIVNYLERDLATYFRKTLEQFGEQFAQLTKEQHQLVERGVFDGQRTVTSDAVPTAVPEVKPQSGWWSWLLKPFTWIASLFVSFGNWIAGLWSKK